MNSILRAAAVCMTIAALNAEEELPPRPPFPDITALELQPDTLTLMDGRDERRVLVWGRAADGSRIDLSSDARLSTGSPNVVLKDKGYVVAKAVGVAEVMVSAAGKESVLRVNVKSADVGTVRFVKDVMPIISSVSCNAGTCHGSAKGKNGFKLSLRGYDPEFDYHAFVHEISGRRINRVEPEKSLMLLKPIAAVPHEGGEVLKKGSREYATILQWIREGVKPEPQNGNRANRIDVLPKEIGLSLPGMTQELIVIAHYPDGTTRDVSRDAVFTSNDPQIAVVKDGKVTAIRRGEASVLVRYEGNYTAGLVAVMGDRTGYKWTQMPVYNFIDEHADAKLKKMKILPSGLSTDAEFLRRAYLDLCGTLPHFEKAREFVEDKTPSKEKRTRLVDELIGSADFIEHWTNKWADLLQCNSEKLGQKGVWSFREWIRRSLVTNKPYNEFVQELITAQGSSYVQPAANYFRALRDTGKITEDVSQTFLGIRFNCNKCHDHPFERWTQNQYYEFGAYFARVAFKKGALKDEEIVYRKSGGEVKHPKTEMNVPPEVPFGKANEATSRRDDTFAAWMTSQENPIFAKSFVNRIWSYFLGRGIIDPVDDIRASNPASNPELLDVLTEDFIKSGFNFRHLVKLICSSRTYQLSFIANKWNEDDTVNFSHAIPRRLSAEQLLDSISAATGRQLRLSGVPAHFRSAQVPDGIVNGSNFLKLFGRPKRDSACECARTDNFSLGHALNLINGPTVSDAIHDPANWLNKMVAEEKDDRRVVENIFYAFVARPPTRQEIDSVDMKSATSRQEMAQDLAWALVNSPSFLFNR